MNLLQASLQALALSIGGMAALAFAMDRHYTQLTESDEVPAVHRSLLRALGALLLIAVWFPAIGGWSGSVSTLLVLGFWSLGALSTALGLAWSARWLAAAAAVAALLGVAGSFWSLAC